MASKNTATQQSRAPAPTGMTRQAPLIGIGLKLASTIVFFAMVTVLKIAAELKCLRGTRFDIFGYNAERRAERRLIADYEETIEALIGDLDHDKHALAVEIAALPEKIRGFGHVKEAHLKDAKACEAELLEAFRHPEKAKAAALRILREHEDLDFIYACSTDVAFGALDALREVDMIGEVTIRGWGGGSGELEMLQEGLLDVTVMRINDDNGVAMAEAIRLDIQDKAEEIPLIYSGDFALVEKGIEPIRFRELKERAFRYSGGN